MESYKEYMQLLAPKLLLLLQLLMDIMQIKGWTKFYTNGSASMESACSFGKILLKNSAKMFFVDMKPELSHMLNAFI